MIRVHGTTYIEKIFTFYRVVPWYPGTVQYTNSVSKVPGKTIYVPPGTNFRCFYVSPGTNVRCFL